MTLPAVRSGPGLAMLAVLLAGAAPHTLRAAPAPAQPGPATLDITPGADGAEDVTVIGQRPSRSWRSKLDQPHLNDPLSSDAARHKSFAQPTPYCNAALRTVGGQPGTAADMMAGAAAGACQR